MCYDCDCVGYPGRRCISRRFESGHAQSPSVCATANAIPTVDLVRKTAADAIECKHSFTANSRIVIAVQAPPACRGHKPPGPITPYAESHWRRTSQEALPLLEEPDSTRRARRVAEARASARLPDQHAAAEDFAEFLALAYLAFTDFCQTGCMVIRDRPRTGCAQRGRQAAGRRPGFCAHGADYLSHGAAVSLCRSPGWLWL